jgi:hypothetical protein
MHLAQVLEHTLVLGRGDQLQIGSQRFQRAERLP